MQDSYTSKSHRLLDILIFDDFDFTMDDLVDARYGIFRARHQRLSIRFSILWFVQIVTHQSVKNLDVAIECFSLYTRVRGSQTCMTKL